MLESAPDLREEMKAMMGRSYNTQTEGETTFQSNTHKIDTVVTNHKTLDSSESKPRKSVFNRTRDTNEYAINRVKHVPFGNSNDLKLITP